MKLDWSDVSSKICACLSSPSVSKLLSTNLKSAFQTLPMIWLLAFNNKLIINSKFVCVCFTIVIFFWNYFNVSQMRLFFVKSLCCDYLFNTEKYSVKDEVAKYTCRNKTLNLINIFVLRPIIIALGNSLVDSKLQLARRKEHWQATCSNFVNISKRIKTTLHQ